MSKKDDKVHISFIGGNAYDVTGSATLIEWNDRHILIDLGIIQGGTVLQDYKDNKRLLTKNKLKNIDMVIVGELHADHTCNLPYITKANKDCRIITPIKHKKIFKCMFEDSALISSRDCEWLSTKFEDRVFEPSYDLYDVEYCVNRIEEYNTNEKIKLDDDIMVRFTYSGHIAFCCQIELWININGKIKKLLFTEDLGNVLNEENRPFTEKLQKVDHADVVISESTYGKREKPCTKKTIEKDLQKFYTVIDQFAVQMKGTVLIPTFSLDRAPAMLYMIWRQYHEDPNFKIKVILDSPLMNRLLDIYLEELEDDKAKLLKEILEWPNIIRVVESEESKFAMDNYKNSIVIASSGMMNIGRSKSWFKKIVGDPMSCCIISGYCSPNTLGAKLKDNKQKTINIDGKSYPNKCNVVNILGQSSHIQRNELIEYLSEINCQKICLVHGNMQGRIELAEDLKEELSKKCKTSKIVIINKGTKISL